MALQADPLHQGVNFVFVASAPGPEDAVLPSQRRICVTLHQCSLLQALKAITRSAQLAFELDADTVLIMPNHNASLHLQTAFFHLSRGAIIRLTDGNATEARERASTLAALRPSDALDRKAAPPVPSIQAQEASIRSFLQRAGVDFEHTPGSTLAFDGSGLIVTQTQQNLGRIAAIVQHYQAVQQVQIETQFVEVSDDVAHELGFNWGLMSRSGNPQASQFNTQNQSLGSLLSQTHLKGSAQGVVSSAEPLGQLMGVIGGVRLQALLRAIEKTQNADVLSSPKLTVLSGKMAHIVVAQELRYPKSWGDIQSNVGSNNMTGGGGAGSVITAATPKDFEMRHVGVKMHVTPVVEPGDKISLLLEPEVTEYEGEISYGGKSILSSSGKEQVIDAGFSQPLFAVRKISTEVTIQSGSTVIMGGLIRESTKQMADKVPGAGNLPLVGKLFRSEGKARQKRNLLIFVTATLDPCPPAT
jgi:general secretion pathway protein D